MSEDKAQFDEESIRTAETIQRSNLLSRAAYTFSAINFLYLAVITFIVPELTAAWFSGICSATVFLLIGFLAKNRRYYKLSAYLAVTILVAAGIFAGSQTGGVDGYIAALIIIAPMPAAIFLGWRETIVTMLVTVAAFIALYWLDQFGLVSIPDRSENARKIIATLSLITATCACGIGIAYFAHGAQQRIRSLINAHGALIRMAQKLDFAANHDPLTGLANRAKLNEHLNSLLGLQNPGSRRLCLMHVDLDNFKQVNDTQGHQIGDNVLIVAADIMREHFDENAMIARIGGDEIVIIKGLTPTDTVDKIQTQCDTLIRKLSTPVRSGNVEIRISASIGYVYAPKSTVSEETLIANADIALYEAKRIGGAKAVKFTPIMRQRFEDRIHRTVEMERALSENRVQCVLQPQVSMLTGEIIGAEALCRIHDPEFGLCLPDQFIEIAEEAGLIDRLDWLIMKDALKALSNIRKAGLNLPNVSINVSAKSLRSPNYAAHLHSAMRAYGLSAKDVVVEVLESVVIQGEDDQAAISVRNLKALGIRVVVDDFGTGQTSLQNLARLNADGLKIDRSLVPNPASRQSIRLSKAVLTFAHSLGVPVTFEGVETLEQYEILQEAGCENVQGFFIGKPMTPESYMSWHREHARSPVHHLQARLVRAMDM